VLARRPGRDPVSRDSGEDAWPPGPGPRLLIADGWYANAGDGAIALAMARSIRRVLPAARLLFCAPHRHLVEHHYPELAMTDPLHGLAARQSALLSEADAVVSKGGGHLFEHYPAGRRLAAYRAVRGVGTPMAFWSQSVGWFGDLDLRAELKDALEGAALFAAREPETIDNLRAMGIEARVRLATDEALMLPVGAPVPQGETVGVAFNALGTAVPGAPFEPGPPGLADTHAEIVERLAAAGGGVRAASSVQGFGHLSDEIEDDGVHHRAVAERLSAAAADSFEVMEGFLAPERLRAELRGLDVVVSSRMHVALLAMLENVPAVYVSGNFKGASIYRRLGLEQLVVPDAEPERVVAAVAQARSARFSIGARLGRLRREARPVAEALLHALGLTRSPA